MCVKARSWTGSKRRWSALPAGGSGVSRGSWPAASQGSNEPETQVCGRYRDVPAGTGTSLVGQVSAGSQGGLRGELLRRESAIGVFSGRPTRRAFTNRIRDGASLLARISSGSQAGCLGELLRMEFARGASFCPTNVHSSAPRTPPDW